MIHQALAIRYLMLAALALAERSGSSQQPVDGQGSQAADWSPSEDSWNYWWSYSGISGPAYWGLLNLDWHMCDKGRRQSPINIETSQLVYDPHLDPLQLDNNLISGILHNDGHALVFNVSASKRRPQTKQQPFGGGIRQNNKPIEAAAEDTGANSMGSGQSDKQSDSGKEAAAAKMVPNPTEPDGRNRRSTAQVDILNDDIVLIRVDSPAPGPEMPTPLAEQAENSTSLNLTRDLSSKVALSISQSEALADSRELLLNQLLITDNRNHAATAEDAYNDDSNNSGDGGGGGGGGDDIGEDDDPSMISKIQITGAGLSYGYRFEAIYFRFGLDNKQPGSEHLINSRWHAAELQILAYNSILYKSFHEASSKPHGLLAISILVDILEHQHQIHQSSNKQQTATNKQLNGQLGKLFEPLNQIKYRNQMIEVKEFNLSELLPDRRHFVTYEGSLNIPGCHESVDWIVLNKPLYMTQSNVSRISESADGDLASESSRPSPSGARLLDGAPGGPASIPFDGAEYSEHLHIQWALNGLVISSSACVAGRETETGREAIIGRGPLCQ